MLVDGRTDGRTERSEQAPFWNLNTPPDGATAPGWALASSTIRLQASRFLAVSPFVYTHLSPVHGHVIQPSHFWSSSLSCRIQFPYNIFFGTAVSCILSIWPSHRILWHLINPTMFAPLIKASNSSFRRILHNSFSFTGPYIIRKISFLKPNHYKDITRPGNGEKTSGYSRQKVTVTE